MKTVLVCSHTSAIRDRLLDQFSEGFMVQAANSPAEVLEHLKEENCDLVIAEARRDHFADFLRRILSIRPGTLVHLFQDEIVFCHYPMKSQPGSVMHAICQAGLSYPGNRSRRPLPTPAGAQVLLNA